MSGTITATKSLKKRKSDLADPNNQIKFLEDESHDLPYFQEKIAPVDLYPLTPTPIEIFQINMGKMCNQICKHCHVDAGPDRKEIMTRETLEQCLSAIEASGAHTVDLTGGAPEMNPHFRWFVEEVSKMGVNTIVRCNLTIILHNRTYKDLPEFYKKHNVELASSLPFYKRDRTDRQRGNGVFDKSIKALQMLNEVGYGKEGTGLVLNLVYNPSGAFLPTGQQALERDFKKALMEDFGIEFNGLFSITNLPISRFLEYLIATDNYEAYMDKLIQAFNPVAAANVMCRNTLSIGWEGYIYDCDFNQMLEMKADVEKSTHIKDFDRAELMARSIRIGRHCFGCTAGAGSSCGGATA